MTFGDMAYSQFVEEMFKKKPEWAAAFVGNFAELHAVMGLSGEVGEVVDIIKKHVFHGKRLDRRHLIEEIGDVEFYLEALRQVYDIDRDFTITQNWNKLTGRHPEGIENSTHYKEGT